MAITVEGNTGMTKHTPGPWQLSIYGGEPSVSVVPDDHGYHPRIAYIDNCYAHFEGQNLRGEAMETANREMREANARLIAAAPDMLAALKALDACRTTETPKSGAEISAAFDAVRAAISRAES